MPIHDRVALIAATGWSGFGLGQDDVEHVRKTIGFGELAAIVAQSGLRYTEVELLTDWWRADERRERSDRLRDLLFEACEALGARYIKIATAFAEPLGDIEPLVRPLRELADRAADRGARLALEPMPFSMVSTVPLGARLVEAAGRPNCGLMIDAWHVFRGRTSMDELRRAVPPELIFGVELDDATEGVVGSLFEDTINERLPCGTGAFELVALIRTLTGLGYPGPWGCEILSRRHRAMPVAEALALAHDSALSVLIAARDREPPAI